MSTLPVTYVTLTMQYSIVVLPTLSKHAGLVAAGETTTGDRVLGKHCHHLCVQPGWPVGCGWLCQTNCHARTHVQPVPLILFQLFSIN